MTHLCFYTFLSVALVSLAMANGVDGKRASLQQLCNLDKRAPDVTKISEVRALIHQIKYRGTSQCPFQVRDAILALEPIVDLPTVCSEEAANEMVDFWSRYVNKKSHLRKNLPEQLKRFFVSFGLQMSKLCKQIMVNELELASRKTEVSEQDLRIVTRPVQESNKLKDIFGAQPKLEGLLVVVRVEPLGRRKKRAKLNMPPKEKKLFEIIQERCRFKFKPIYDSLILPIVRLASIGINYKSKPLDAVLNSFSQRQIYLDWYSAVLTCEPALRHEPVLIPAKKLDAVGEAAIVTILEEEDIEELREKTGLTLEEPPIVEPVDYEVSGAQLDNLVLDSGDKNLMSSLKWYGVGLKEANKFKVSLIGRLPKILKLMIKSNKVKVGLKRDSKSGKKTGLERVLSYLMDTFAPTPPMWIVGTLIFIVVIIIYVISRVLVPLEQHCMLS